MKELRTDVEKMREGFYESAAVVTSTLGPHKSQFFNDDGYTPRSISDGVRVANAINFKDGMKNAGAYFVKNASAKTNDEVGDGTTTTVAMLESIASIALKRPENKNVIRHSLAEALPRVVELLKESSVPMKDEDIERVAMLTSEDAKLASCIKEIYAQLGYDAAIQIEDSKTGETKYEIEDGYRLYEGFMSEWFFTDEKTRKSTLEDVPVIVASQKLAKNVDLMPIAQQFKEKGISQCAFFLADVDDQMLGLLVKNHLMKNFQAIVVRCNGEQLEDLAAITGTKIVGEQSGVLWEKLKLEDLGRAEKIVTDRSTTLIQANGKAAQARALELEINATDEPNMYRQARLQERAARLRGKIAILKVGGHTEMEREDKELKAEDAIKAIPAAFSEGLVQGGGLTLWKVSQKIKGDTVGEQILKQALKAPFKKLMENAGRDDEVPTKEYERSVADVVDPLKVERVSLEVAVTQAGLFITTTAAGILDRNEQNGAVGVGNHP